MPTVSVIIPAYRVTAYIAEALDSVLQQSLSDYEVIVVNDGCPDTEALERALAPYLARIRYLKRERNSGVAAARNAGIEASQAPYIAFLDGDDRWDPRYLEIHLELFRDDPALDVVYGNARIFGPSADAGKLAMDLLPSRGEVTFSSLICMRCNVCISSTVRREMLLRVGMFDVTQRRCEDFDLWLRIAKAGGKFAYHREATLHYRKRDNSQSSDVRLALLAMIDLARKIQRDWQLTASERDLTERQARQWRAELDLAEGKGAFEAGKMEEALGHLEQAQRHFHTRKLAMVLLALRATPNAVLWVYRLRNRWLLARTASMHQ